MKKILALLTAASIATVSGVSALAADKEKGEPDVIVDGSKIIFEDQNAKIVDDVTLVPARGVFEAMDCKVDWNEEDRTVNVSSSTGVREVVIAIDSKEIKISTFKSLMEKENTEYELEVPAQIINDRTMIPLRAVSEAFDCEVVWDGEAYAVNITTGDPILLEGYTYTEPDENSMVKMSLSTDYEGALSEGAEFDVYITVDNMKNDSYLSALVALLEYDKKKIEYVPGSGMLLDDNGNSIESADGIENSEHELGAKLVFATIDDASAKKSSGKVFKATFKSITGESAEISLNNNFTPVKGYASYVQFTSGEGENLKDIVYDGNNLILDTTPITIGE